jgi:uncharacterized membrane protein
MRGCVWALAMEAAALVVIWLLCVAVRAIWGSL